MSDIQRFQQIRLQQQLFQQQQMAQQSVLQQQQHHGNQGQQQQNINHQQMMQQQQQQQQIYQHQQQLMRMQQEQLQQQQQLMQDKNRKKRPPNERNLPKKIDSYVPESKVYVRMQEFERRLDATIMRKMLDVHDALQKPPKTTKKKLRIFLSNTASNQEPAISKTPGMEKTPSWTFKIQGKLLNAPNSTAKFSSFFKRIVVQVERDSTYAGNIIEWYNNPNQSESDGFEIKRHGDASVNLKISLFVNHVPEKLKLSAPLAAILDIESDTFTNVLLALWQYVKVNRLQDPEDKRHIACNVKLTEIFQTSKIYLPNLAGLLNQQLSPCDPICLSYTVRVDQKYHKSKQAFDITVPVRDLLNETRLHSLVQSSGTNISTPIQREIEILDEKMSAVVKNLSLLQIKRDFMLSFATDPVKFIKQWCASQSRDLEVIMGDLRLNMEEEGSNGSWLFENEGFEEALFHYIRSKDVQ